jgi:hypothetical protein
MSEQERFIEVLNWISDNCMFDPENEIYTKRQKLMDIYNKLNSTYTSLGGGDELRKLLKAKTKFELLEIKQFIYLKPEPYKYPDVLPVMSLKFDFDDSSNMELRIRVAFFSFNDKVELRAMGYRFETHEGEGKHNYCHSQPIKGFDKSTPKYQLPCEDWLLTAIPTFPLEANTPSGLLTAFLCSVYSQNEIRSFVGGMSSGLKNHLKDCEYIIKSKKSEPATR